MNKIFLTKNLYLAACLASKPDFEIGKIYIAPEDVASQKATIEILYTEDYQTALDSYILIFNKKKFVVYQDLYQKSIRFIMGIVNARKSGISE